MSDRKPAPNFERLPPHSIEAEQAVLGCLLLDPKDALVEVQQRIGETQIFYDPRHETVYRALTSLVATGTPIDIITLTGRLTDGGELEKIGGFAFLSSLMDSVASPAQLPTYLDDVWRKYQLRQTIRRATEIAAEAYDIPEDVDGFLSRAEEKVFGLPRGQRQGPQTAQSLAQKCIDRIEHYNRGRGLITGQATGYWYWDKLTGGLQNGELIVIGGRPGTGKTSLAMNVAERVAWWDEKDGTSRPGNPVGVLSMEMSADDLMLRLVCSRARVNFHKLRTGMMSNDDMAKLENALPQMARAPIVIDDASNLTAFEMRSKLRQMKARYGIKLAIIDYIQLAKLPHEFAGDRVNGIAHVSAALLASAKELQIPIIVISQLSRESEKGRSAGGIPKMSDLRDSGAIEQDAHFIGLLYRAPMEQEEEAELRERIARDPHCEVTLPVKMEVCKNRNGPSGTGMDLNFLRWCMRFEDCQRPTKAPSAPSESKPAKSKRERQGELGDDDAMKLAREMGEA